MDSPVWGRGKHTSKYRIPRPDEPLWIMFDGGNTDVKAMIHAHWGEEIVFPHSVRKVGKADYNTLAGSYTHRRAEFEETAIFRSQDQGYVVGRHATQVGQGERKKGPAKYTRDHYGAMFEAAMIQLHPDDHPDVRVIVLHPPRLEPANLKRLWQSINGAHCVELPDGRAFIYNVTEIIPLEEPVSALQSFLFNTDGKTYANPRLALKPGMEVLVLDIGGGLSVFVPCIIRRDGRIDVNINGAPVIDKGIQNVVETLESELKNSEEFGPYLGHLTRLPSSMMHNALMTGLITIKGTEYDCAHYVANAMQSIADPIRTQYTNRYEEGVNFGGVIIGGGGGGVSFNYISSTVLNHPFIFTAEDDMERMRFGGIRGASKGLITFLAANGRK